MAAKSLPEQNSGPWNGRKSQQPGVTLPIYFMERELMTKEQSMKHPLYDSEMYHWLIQKIKPDELRAIQRVGALWHIYLQNNEARAKLLLCGVFIRGRHVSLLAENPFTLKARMANLNAIEITFKDLPDFEDDKIIIDFLEGNGCTLVTGVMRRFIRYKNQLTKCSNGDRVVYIANQLPSDTPRVIKLGQFYVKCYFQGQQLLPAQKLNKTKRTLSVKKMQQQQKSLQPIMSDDPNSLEDFIDEAHERILGPQVTPVPHPRKPPAPPLLPPPSSSSSVLESDNENRTCSANLAVIVEGGGATAEEEVEGSGEEKEEVSTRVDGGLVGGAIDGAPLDFGRRREEASLSAECSDCGKKGGEGCGEEEAEVEKEMEGSTSDDIPPEKGASPSMKDCVFEEEEFPPLHPPRLPIKAATDDSEQGNNEQGGAKVAVVKRKTVPPRFPSPPPRSAKQRGGRRVRDAKKAPRERGGESDWTIAGRKGGQRRRQRIPDPDFCSPMRKKSDAEILPPHHHLGFTDSDTVNAESFYAVDFERRGFFYAEVLNALGLSPMGLDATGFNSIEHHPDDCNDLIQSIPF